MANYFLHTDTHNIWWNLATEKYLAGRTEAGDVYLYLWQNEKTVVIGRNQNAFRECRTKLLEQDGGCLARRETGGGAVYHDLGNLCFTFAASPERYDLEKQLSVIQEACLEFGIKTELSGRNDIITEDGFKFSGNAFSAGSRCRIHHGTLMLNVDRDDMSRYLCPSREKMQAKGVISVKARVRNLCEINPKITVADMCKALQRSFEKKYGAMQEISAAMLDKEQIEKTYALYKSWEWKYGKTPDYSVTFSRRFDWGEVEVREKLSGMKIQDTVIFSDALDTELPEKLRRLLIGEKYDMEDISKRDILMSDSTEEQKKNIQEVINWLADVSAR